MLNAGWAMGTCTTRKTSEAYASKGEGNTGSGPGLGGQVTTATPLLQVERARKALGSLQWIPGWTPGQPDTFATGSKSEGLSVAADGLRRGLERGLFCGRGAERGGTRG